MKINIRPLIAVIFLGALVGCVSSPVIEVEHEEDGRPKLFDGQLSGVKFHGLNIEINGIEADEIAIKYGFGLDDVCKSMGRDFGDNKQQASYKFEDNMYHCFVSGRPYPMASWSVAIAEEVEKNKTLKKDHFSILGEKYKNKWGKGYFSGNKNIEYRLDVKAVEWEKSKTAVEKGISANSIRGKLAYELVMLSPDQKVVFSLEPIPFSITKIYSHNVDKHNLDIIEKILERTGRVFQLLMSEAAGKDRKEELAEAEESLVYQFEGSKVWLQRFGQALDSGLRNFVSGSMDLVKELSSAAIASAAANSRSSSSPSGYEIISQNQKQLQKDYAAIQANQLRSQGNRGSTPQTNSYQYSNSAPASQSLSFKEKSIARRNIDLEKQCNSKGGKYNVKTKDCLKIKKYDTVAINNPGVNTVYGNPAVPGSNNYRGNSASGASVTNSNSNSGYGLNTEDSYSGDNQQSGKCGVFSPPISTHPLPVLTSKGIDHLDKDGAFPTLERNVYDRIEETCGNLNFRISGGGRQFKFEREIIGKKKKSYSFNKVELTVREGQKFDCLCTPQKVNNGPSVNVTR